MTDLPILLDTCAAIWISQGDRIGLQAVRHLDEAVRQGRPIFVSPITAWEVGILSSKGRLSLPFDPGRWFTEVIATPNVVLAEMPADVLIASSFLPGMPPRDPGDRIILATARTFGFRVMTRDRLLLAYAEQGHVSAVAC